MVGITRRKVILKQIGAIRSMIPCKLKRSLQCCYNRFNKIKSKHSNSTKIIQHPHPRFRVRLRMGTGCNGCGTACATGFAAGFMDGGIAITLAPGSICTGRGACGNTMGCFGRGAGTGGRTM